MLTENVERHVVTHVLTYYQILSGSLTEVRFAWPDKDGEDQEMRVIGETDLHTNDVTYMSGKSEEV